MITLVLLACISVALGEWLKLGIRYITYRVLGWEI